MDPKEDFVHLKKGHMTENEGASVYWESANETWL